MGKGKKIKVAVLMGSKSDLDTVQESINVLKDFKVAYEVRVLSAHRTPKDVVKYVEQLPARGAQVIIAAAGMSAALAGTVAAHTILPVIGIPIDTKTLQGLDSLLSTVQMPKGIPVATFAIGEAGAANAGLFAVALLALSDPATAARLESFRKEQAERIKAMTLPELE